MDCNRGKRTFSERSWGKNSTKSRLKLDRVSLGFVMNQRRTVFHPRGESTIVLTEAATRRDSLVPHGVCWNSSRGFLGANQSNYWESGRQSLTGKTFSSRRVETGSQTSSGKGRGLRRLQAEQLANVSLFNRYAKEKYLRCRQETTSDLVAVDRETGPPVRKCCDDACFQDGIGRATSSSEESTFGRRDGRCKVLLALRPAECRNGGVHGRSGIDEYL